MLRSVVWACFRFLLRHTSHWPIEQPAVAEAGQKQEGYLTQKSFLAASLSDVSYIHINCISGQEWVVSGGHRHVLSPPERHWWWGRLTCRVREKVGVIISVEGRGLVSFTSKLAALCLCFATVKAVCYLGRVAGLIQQKQEMAPTDWTSQFASLFNS